METNQKVTYGLIGVLSLIVSALGGTIYLSEDQLDNAYICTTNQNVVIADHLSSTFKTAYWTDETGSKSKTCVNGIWRNLEDYARENNIEINVLLKNVNEEIINDPRVIDETRPIKNHSHSSSGGSYLCPPKSENKPCEEIR
jgi:hypothetical protein